MQSLLTPSGILVCLEFPLYKDLEAEGPPWGLKGAYWNLLAEGGDGYVKNLNEDVNDRSTIAFQCLPLT
jgi:methyl halide transferase